MKKPIPTEIKFSLGDHEGWIKLNNNYIETGHGPEDPNDPYSGCCLDCPDKTHTAYVLLSIAKTLLDQTEDAAASKQALLESGLFEGGVSKSASNDLKLVSLGLGYERSQAMLSEEQLKPKPKSQQTDKTGGLLEQEVKATLLQGGIDPDIVACFDSMSGYALALNNGPNPVKAARTMSGREKFGPILADFKKRQAKSKPSGRESAAAPDLKCSSCGELLNSKDANTVHAVDGVFTHKQDGELCVALAYEDILGPDGKIVNTCKGCGTGDFPPCCKQCPNYVEPPAMPDVDEL